jgi:uncharacterized membrane protein YesL
MNYKTIPTITLLLLSAALYNGYPLVYSDTGTYIGSGFLREIPNDRPITYGLLIWLTSGGGLSLWLTVAAQSLLLALVMHRTVTLLWPGPGAERVLIGTTALLCLLTPLPWYSSQLMPDIFTSIQILLIVNTLLDPALSRLRLVVYGFLFLLCCLVHFSNLFIGLGTLVAVGSWLYLSKKGQRTLYQRLLVLGIWSISAFLAMPALNYTIGGQWVLSKGGYTFLIGRMIDSGMLKQYLDDHCADNQFRLCAYKDSLPANSRLFHWDDKSPLTKEGGWGNVATEAEYRKIVHGTLTSPKYLTLHLWESLIATPVQLMQNAIGSGLDYKWYRSPASPPWQNVERWFPHEHNEYQFSRQCGNLWKQELNFEFFNNLLFWVLALSIGVLLYGWYGADWPAHWQMAFVIMGFGILLNAFITASLGSICDRFPSRVVWLVPFAAILIVWRQLKSGQYLARS